MGYWATQPPNNQHTEPSHSSPCNWPRYPQPSAKNPKERTTHTTCNETVDELNQSILAKFSGVTHTFAGYDKVVHKTQERQGHYSDNVDQAMLPNTYRPDTKWPSKGQNWHLKWGAQWGCYANWIHPKASEWNKAIDCLHLYTCLWVSHFGGGHDRKPAFIPHITLYIRVTLPSSLHAVNSQFALPLQWQSTKAKNNLSGM